MAPRPPRLSRVMTLTGQLWTLPIQVLQEGLIAGGVPSLPSAEGGSLITGRLVVRYPAPPTLDVLLPPPGLRTGHWMGRTGLGP